MKATGGLLLLAAFLAIGIAHASQYNNNRRTFSDQDRPQQQQQQAEPFQSGQQYTFDYNGQISTGLNTNGAGQSSDEPQQKAVSRIQAQAQITFQSNNQATLRLEQVRVGQLNKHIDDPQQVQPMPMFNNKNIDEDNRRQLGLPLQFEYNEGVVGTIKFHVEDAAWSKNIKRSILNLIQLNLKQQQRQQSSEQGDDNKTKSFTLSEATIEGECQTTYTVNKNNKAGGKQQESSEEQQRQQQGSRTFNVTKSVNFKQCKKIADVGYGYQTQQQQPECAKCQQQQQGQQATGQQQQPGPCGQCDPKEIKEQTLDRTTVLRFVLTGQPENYAIQRSELISQYAYKTLRAQSSQYSSVMEAVVVAELVFRSSQQPNQKQLQQLQDLSADTKKSTLLYDNEFDVDEKRFYMNGDDEFGRNAPFINVPNKVEQAQQILRKLTQSASDKAGGIEFDQLVHLQRLVELLRMCTVEELNEIHSTVTRGQGKASSFRSESEQQKAVQILADCLAIAGTRNTIAVLADKIKNGELNAKQALQSMQSLRGLVAPSDRQADIILALCQNEAVHRSSALKQTCWLTFGSMVGELCQHQTSKKNGEQQSVFGAQTGFSNAKDMCQSEKKESYKQALMEQYQQAENTYEKVLALKAIGNAGIDTCVQQLEKIATDRREDRIVRTQAIDGLRRLRTQMSRKIQRALLPIFQNTRDHPQVRMAAFSMIMHTQPEQPVVDQIAYTLIKERQPEVQSFVYSTMKVLSKSKVPSQQQLAKHMENILKLANIDEQSLRSSRKYQVPIYSDQQQEGAFFNLVSVFNGAGMLPNHLSASMDSMLNDEHELSSVKIALTQQGIEQWYEQLVQNVLKIANQRRSSSTKTRGQRTSSSSSRNNAQDLEDIFKTLKITSRLSKRSSYHKQQRDSQEQQPENDEDDQQEKGAKNQPFGMICVRIGDVDQAILPIDQQIAPRSLKQLMKGQQPRLSEWMESFSDGQHFRILAALNLNEKTAKIPTSLGLPLRVLQATPMMAAIEGSVKVNAQTGGSNSAMGIKAEVNLHTTACIAHVQKMECWMPIMATGVESTRAIELNAPIQAEIKADREQGIKVTFKIPQVPMTRILGVHTLPSTYTRDWDTRQKMLREPKVKSIHNQQLEQLQRTINKQVGEHAFGMPFRVQGHYHLPARVTDYKQIVQLLMATENHVHVNYEPKETSPKEVILRISGDAFGKTEDSGRHGPELDNFYSIASQFEKAYPEDDFEDMQLDNHEQSRRKLNGFLGKFQPGQMYKHALKLSAQTTGGRKHLNAELKLNGACDAKFKYCKAYVEVDRTAMYPDEKSDWKLTSKIQVLTPDSVNNVQQLAELEQKNQKFVLQSDCEWGCDQKQSVNLRIQGLQAQNRQQRQQIQNYRGPQQHYQKKRSAFLNKFDVVADYKLKPTMQNTFNRVFECLKAYNYWNTQSKLQENGRDSQIRATMVIDPIGQQLANISVNTGAQAVRIQSVELPTEIRPFALVRQSDKSSHSVQQLFTRMTSGKGRAECTVDGKRVDTFDGVLYKAPIGKCYSVLAKDCSDNKPRFVVLMKALNEDGQDKKIKVITPQQTIVCEPTKSGSSGKKLECKIDGQKVNANGDYDDSSSNNQDNNVNENGQRVVEYNNEDQTDVTINVEGVSVRFGCWCNSCKCQKAWIKISKQYKEGQCGLCGHYDDQADNDLRMGNNDETDDLQQFHRSFSLKDDECTDDDQNTFYGQKNKKQFRRVDMAQHRRSKKSHMMDEEEEGDYDNQDAEWQAGGYESSEEQDQWSQMQSKPWKQQQKHQQQRRRQGKNGEEEPIQQTKVIEFNHKICFSAQPIKQCPEGTSPANEEESQAQQQQQPKKVQFICLSRSSTEARRLQRQARQGVNVDLPSQSPSFVEAVAQPTRCVAY